MWYGGTSPGTSPGLGDQDRRTTMTNELLARALLDRLAGSEAVDVGNGRVRLVRVLEPTAAELQVAELMGRLPPKREPLAVHPAVVKLARAARR